MNEKGGVCRLFSFLQLFVGIIHIKCAKKFVTLTKILNIIDTDFWE